MFWIDHKQCAIFNSSYKDFKKQLSRDVVLSVSAICLTQPFHVISVRMMAQFVGHETAYSYVDLKQIVE